MLFKEQYFAHFNIARTSFVSNNSQKDGTVSKGNQLALHKPFSMTNIQDQTDICLSFVLSSGMAT